MSRIAFAISGFTPVLPTTDDRCWFDWVIPQGTSDPGGFNETTEFAWIFCNRLRACSASFNYTSDFFGSPTAYTGSGVVQIQNGTLASELDLITGRFGEQAYNFSSTDGNIAAFFESYLDLNLWHFRCEFAGHGISSVPFLGGSTSGVTVNILGHSLPMYAAAGVTATGNFSLTQNEYWAYANADGVPVWDTTTGEELITPPPQGF